MIGIAIINYRTYKKTIECIDSIKATMREPYRIYLLENGSQNESEKELEKKYSTDPYVKLIISKTNEGYARGNNICFRYMKQDNCEMGVVSNNDIICHNNTISMLIENLRKDSSILLVGPKIISPEGEFQKSIQMEEVKGLKYLLYSSYIGKYIYGSQMRKDNEDALKLDSLTEVAWVSGAFFAFSMKNMEKIDYFDPETFLFFEEKILAYKAKKYKMKLMYNPIVEVVHYHAYSTGGALNIISKIAADQSERYYFIQYVKSSKLFLTLLMLQRIVEVVYSFGKRKNFIAIKKYIVEMRKKV